MQLIIYFNKTCLEKNITPRKASIKIKASNTEKRSQNYEYKMKSHSLCKKKQISTKPYCGQSHMAAPLN
jgi:hypothetical protein